jgi:hypothetical protein
VNQCQKCYKLNFASLKKLILISSSYSNVIQSATGMKSCNIYNQGITKGIDR